MDLPKSLKKFQKQAQEIVDKGLVEEVEFSGETYQLLVPEKKGGEGAWAFMQLDSKGGIKDAFCSCDTSDDDEPCIHIAASFLRIYNGRDTPLHLRFKNSLWNLLCLQSLDKFGDDPEKIEHKTGDAYTFYGEDRNTFFEIKANSPSSQKRLEEIINYRKEETEETSLKFSNLTAEDLDHWRHGKPPPELRYELSFWSDIAKWLMFMQDLRAPYNILFEYSEKMLPEKIKISFPEIEAIFTLTRSDLIQIIPTLAKVNSPLAVHTTQREAIQKITYDKENGVLIVKLKDKADRKKQSSSEASNPGEISIGGWNYIPGQGFYAIDQHHMLARPNISGKRLCDVLNTHGHIIKRLLVGDSLTEEPIKASYSLSFDEAWNLHISMYLFDPGDLNRKYSRTFGNWVYHDNQGFYRIEGRLFEEVETVIPSEKVHHFVTKHRAWLNTIEGFDTHITPLEVKVAYHVNESGSLVFERGLAIGEGVKTRDFGPWVYINGQGFYSKVRTQISLPIDPGLPISAYQVSSFIQNNREELKLIPGFFSEKCPVTHAFLDFKIIDNDSLEIVPRYTIENSMEKGVMRHYGDVVYVEGKGFYELPLTSRLPLEYHDTKFLKGKPLEHFLETDFEKICHYAETLDNRLKVPEKISLKTDKITKIDRSGVPYYGMQLEYCSEFGSVNVTDLWAAIHEKKHYIFSGAGLIDLRANRFHWLRKVKKKQIDRRSNTLYLTLIEYFRLHAFDPVDLRSSRRKDYEESKQYFDEMNMRTIIEEPDISLLKSELRPYQNKGVLWLWYLYMHQLSGLLCDDMGLGKTHQSMALIAAIAALNKSKGLDESSHYLIICPTSVIYHWQEKLEQFLPDLRICTYHGSNRSLQDFRKEYDVLLTSYGVWRNEVKLLGQVPFRLAIFDEVQIAKNHTSRIHKALTQVNAEVRIGLTGTPIENRIRELKSLFDVALPGFMPSEEDYNKAFVKPIEKENDKISREILARLIHPFMLRRKKEDVLKDLPPKVEEVAHCDLMPEQLSLYNDVLKQSHKRIVDELRNNGNPVPYIHIFALLSNLKQICNHPAVYYKNPDDYEMYESGKWNLFTELLSEARNSSQKVVVFSQYLNMLDIMENYLQKEGIAYASVRGSTIKRGEEVKRFNTDPECEVFLGSLQATGLGVDLTAASVVIHYDRWWNAAREDQATDRVHRIGQQRGVQVFKLVTKNTFEEKIDQLIERKGKLMEEVVGVDDDNFVKNFSRSELIELLQYVEWK